MKTFSLGVRQFGGQVLTAGCDPGDDVLGRLARICTVVDATISGTVTDPSGAAVPNAKVTATNVETGVNRSVSTNQIGFYALPNLSPGEYSVSFAAPGFATAQQPKVTSTVGENGVLNSKLQVAKISEVVQVTGAPPAVENNSGIESTIGPGYTGTHDELSSPLGPHQYRRSCRRRNAIIAPKDVPLSLDPRSN